MSDFTKEELESLVAWGDVYTEIGYSLTDKEERPLIEKIQSMIDNYCEHEECPEIRDSNLIKVCPKCGKHHDE